MHGLALKLLFQSLIVLLDMESFIKKLNPTWLTSFSFAPRSFLDRITNGAGFLCGFLIKGLEDIWQKTCFKKNFLFVFINTNYDIV